MVADLSNPRVSLYASWRPSIMGLQTASPSCATHPCSPPTALGLSSGTEAEGALVAAAPVAISCWRGRACLNVLVSKQECSQIEERLTLGLEPAAEEHKEESAAVAEPADQ